MLIRKLVFIIIFLPTFVFADAFKIGAILPLTGDLAHIGVDIRRGMELAHSELTDAKKNIAIVFEDNQFIAKNAATAAQKLIVNDKVNLLVSLWDNADVVAPIAERAGVPHLAIRWNPQIAVDNKYTFTFESTYFSYVEKQIELIKMLNVKTLGILVQEQKSPLIVSSQLKKRAKEEGINVIHYDSFVTDSADLRTLVTKVKRKAPDYLVLNIFPPYIELTLNKLKELAYPNLISGDFETIQQLSLIEGMPSVGQYQAADWFKQKFYKKYGEEFKVRAPHGYDIVALVDSFQKNNSFKFDANKLASFLSSLNGFEGAAGTLTTSKEGSIETACVFKIVENGKRIALKDKHIMKIKLTG